MMQELEKIKREVNIAEFAQSFGYAIDKKKSTKNAPVLRNSDGDKIVVGVDPKDNHYRYFSVHDDADRGSIIDFVQRRTGESLGHIRKRLRRWLNMPDPHIERVRVVPAAADTTEAKIRSQEEWRSIESSQFYSNIREISYGTLEKLRQEGRIKKTQEGEICFALTDGEGEIVGIEKRDREGRNARLGAGQKKGIFYFGNENTPKAIIITESTIDAISAAEIGNDAEENLFVSLGGNSGKMGDEALRGLLDRYPGARIMIATDNDPAGELHAAHIVGLLSDDEKGRAVRVRPAAKDWNDELIERREQEREEEMNHAPSFRPSL